MSDVVLVVDVANVVGSTPDGWWRDRVGANERLLSALVPLLGQEVDHGGTTVTVSRVLAVVEGAARGALAPAGIEVVRAQASGDDALVEAVRAVDGLALVVTADRGLLSRLGGDVRTAGPGWLRHLLGA